MSSRIPQASFLTPPVGFVNRNLPITNTTPPIEFDPYFYYVNILCSLDGLPVGSKTCVDQSLFLTNEDIEGLYASITDEESKWGTTSLKLTNQDWLGATWEGSRYGRRLREPYTYEFWWKHVFNTYNSTASPNLIRVGGPGFADVFQLSHYALGNQLQLSTSSGPIVVNYTPAADGWNHVALVITPYTSGGDTLTLYFNGVAIAATGAGVTNAGTFGNIRLGGFSDNFPVTYPCLDYFSDFRVTRGIARYTSNFTPPTKAFIALGPYASEDPYFPFVSMNLHLDQNPPVDSSWRAQQLNANFGDNRWQSATNPKFGPSCYSGITQGFPPTVAIFSDESYANTFYEYDGCVECWLRADSAPTDGAVPFAMSNVGVALLFPGSTVARVYYGSNIMGTVDILNGYLGQWIHIAIVKQGTNFTLYRNGINIWTGSNGYYASGPQDLNMGTLTPSGLFIPISSPGRTVSNGGKTASTDITKAGITGGQVFSVSATGGTSYLWNFGDGSTSTSASTTKFYPRPGKFRITVTIDGTLLDLGEVEAVWNFDLRSTGPWYGAIDDFRITNGVPRYTANFTPPTRANPDGFPVGDVDWLWKFSSTDTSTEFEPTYAYAKPGIKTVSLTASNFYGSTTATQQVDIRDYEILDDEKTLFLKLKQVTDEEYAYIRMRGVTNSLPAKILDNGGYPNRQLFFWPIPNDSSKAVELWLWEPLQIYDLDEELNMPPGYERYYTYALALELCDIFSKKPTKEILYSLQEAESMIRTLNQVDYQSVPTNAAKELNRSARAYNYIDFVSGAAMLPRDDE